MALLAAATLNPTTHLSLRSRAGRNSENLWLRSAASSQKSKGRFCNLTIRAGTPSKPAEPIGPVFTKLKPWQIPKRDWFDKDFLFGASTSAYQIEGAWNEDGKGPSTWDHFCHTYPERISDMTNGDVAANSYHLYEEDVKALKDMGMKVYRFSISWSRILPDGTGKVNQAGIDYYNKLINSLIDNDIVPYVTIWHWDTPQALEDKYGGFLNRQIVDDYKQFAEVCFKNFGDRVKNWFTFNEPHTYCCFSMRSLIGDRLPMFTKEEQEKLASSCDIMGLNYYTSRFSKHVDMSPDFTPTLNTDDAYASSETTGSDGNDIGPITGTYWIYMYPKGLTDLLLIMKEKYGNPPVFITENGIADVEGDESMPDPLDDWKRLDYLQRHISAVKDAIDQGADVRGHFTWGLIDNFEWSLGYSSRFGLVYIDKNDGNKRKLKKSAKWFSKFNSVPKPLLKTTNNNATMTAASVSV
ncbi:unnamed protein product [Triticum turgidum subsp. durum]|uniref:4-hydroxy-7-methoxy-3-oxo-3,4-dihydro-2H-1,4-benzoxazin-2-yl glucosidebeta-D-glucosidase n=1 Tax=Triticum turgidum subsp. durum TaxID=4567 RepID=A0A9R1Q328_TRITD|nr:unnamed protein product [Triticum turgidum subsp. durum]